MKILKQKMNRLLLVFIAAPIVSMSVAQNVITKVDGPFNSTAESLATYKCPVWFRDAKFGIWAHWGPQSVPMAGDWYARYMYSQDDPRDKRGQYKDHIARYGHPSVNGWKDIIPLWKAEKFDPDRLMALYKNAGAKYFVSMGVHHDNFDLWNSKYQHWNAVKMGPRRDIVGDWQKAAKKLGMPFGVSEHLAASFTWWQSSHGSDKTGPMSNIPYDGADPKFEDLYHWKASVGDKAWYTTDERFFKEWYRRISDLLETYHPDLLYSDGGLPFGNYGRTLLANYYNESIKLHGGLEAVYNCKDHRSGELIMGSCVQDMERGLLPGINSEPWQTDTSIGDWFYNSNWKTNDTGGMYRSPEWVIHTLVDIVSKNGNLLLNVIQRPDGTIDAEVEQLLEAVGAWLKINGDAIYGTRPWTTFGEGPALKVMTGGHWKEDFEFTAQDIRFTTKKSNLYAITLGVPTDAKLRIFSLAKQKCKVSKIELLGYDGKIKWAQTDNVLEVDLPANYKPSIGLTLKITGDNIVSVN